MQQNQTESSYLTSSCLQFPASMIHASPLISHLRWLFTLYALLFPLLPFILPFFPFIAHIFAWQTFVLFLLSALPCLQGPHTRASKCLTLLLGGIGALLPPLFYLSPFPQAASHPFLTSIQEYLMLFLCFGASFLYWKMAYRFLLRPSPHLYDAYNAHP